MLTYKKISMLNYIFYFLFFSQIVSASWQEAKVGEIWMITEVSNLDDFFLIYKIPEKVNVKPYWKDENNKYVIIRNLPIEVVVRKLGGTGEQIFYQVDLYGQNKYDPNSKRIVATGWLPSWLVTKADQIIDKSRSRILKGIKFAVDSHEITSFPDTIITNIKEQYAKYKHIKLLIEGYTDNTGEEDYNLKLSLRRAKSVADYIMLHTGLPQKQISYVGYGEAKPKGDNETKEGRALNRRIEMKMYR